MWFPYVNWASRHTGREDDDDDEDDDVDDDEEGGRRRKRRTLCTKNLTTPT